MSSERDLVSWLFTVGELCRALGEDAEQMDPRLIVGWPDGRMGYYLLHVTPDWRGRLPSLVRLLVGAAGARYAAVSMEMWSADLARSNPLAALLAARHIEVKDLPPELRHDSLYLFGQDREQHTVWRHWHIQPGRPRTYKQQEDEGVTHKSRYLPLFDFPMIERGRVEFGLSEEEVWYHQREACKMALGLLPITAIPIAQSMPGGPN